MGVMSPHPIKYLARKAVNFSREFFLTSSFKFSKLIFELGGDVPFHVLNNRDSVEGLLRFVVFRILEQLKFSAGEVQYFMQTKLSYLNVSMLRMKGQWWRLSKHVQELIWRRL